MIEREFKMPPEWHPHRAIWLAWPHNRETWPTRLREAQTEFARLAETIATATQVRICGGGGQATAAVHDAFKDSSAFANGRITILDIATDDAWIRDYGPTFVQDVASGNRCAVDWDYNAWGGKYPPFDQDQQVAEKIATHLEIQRLQPGFCFEGGAIEVNGNGIVLSTRSCALDPARNQRPDIDEIESLFARYLGAEKTIWLSGDAIEGDDTDGHIDQLARFVDDRRIVYAWTDDPADSQRDRLSANLDDLQSGLEGLPDSFDLIPLPLPRKPVIVDGARLPASYCNFLITNGLVIVPQFEDANDPVAVETLGALLPDHRVSGSPSRFLVAGLGSFHCLSQQQPE